MADDRPQYCAVRAGALIPPPPGRIIAEGRPVTRNPFARPSMVGPVRIGPAVPDAELAALGIWRLVITERGDPPGLDYRPVTAAPSVDVAAQVVRVVESWQAMDAEELADALAAARRAKLAELAAEAETRLAAVNDWVTTIDAYQVLQAIILTIKPTARDTIPALLLAIKAVADAGQAARTAIQALTTLADLAAYDVTTDPDWP